VFLIDTPYFGEVLSTAPEVANPGQSVVITGRAVDRATGANLAAVSLKPRHPGSGL